MSAGWLTLLKVDKSLHFNVCSKTFSKDDNQDLLLLNLSWPLGYEHNDQDLDTKWLKWLSACVCALIFRTRSEFFKRFRWEALLHSVQRSLQSSAVSYYDVSQATVSHSTASRPQYLNCVAFKAMWKLPKHVANVDTHKKNISTLSRC